MIRPVLLELSPLSQSPGTAFREGSGSSTLELPHSQSKPEQPWNLAPPLPLARSAEAGLVLTWSIQHS